MSLKDELLMMKNRSTKKAPRDAVKIMEDAAKNLLATDIVEKAIKEGEVMPSFELINQKDEIISSQELLSDGPLIMTFYRGSW